MDRVVSLFVQAYSATGPDANEKIQMAEAEIRQLEGTPEFCTYCCQIVETSTLPDPVRRAVSAYLARMIDNHWCELPNESKEVIVREFGKMVRQGMATMYKLMMRLTNALVKATYRTGEVAALLEMMQTALQSKDSNEFIIGLMIAKSVAMEFRSADPSMEESYDALSESLLVPLTQVVGEGSGYVVLALAFQIARHFSIRAVPKTFRENSEMLLVWFKRAMTVCEVSSDPGFAAFVRCAVKFCSEYFYRYGHLIPDECAVNVMNSIVAITNPDTPNKILGRCVQFLKWAMDVTSTWNSISSDLINFLQLIVLPLFAMDENDLNDAMNDPGVFLQNFHAKSRDASDPRSYLLQALSHRARKSQELCMACTQLLFAYLEQPSPEYDRSKYAACHLFSAVAQHADALVITKIASLIKHPSFIVRVGGLVALQNAPCVPGEVVLEMMAMLQDESILVQYFAAVDLCTFLEKLSVEESNVVRQTCGPNLVVIIGSYFRLSQEFYDYQLIEFIRTIVEFFGPQLIGSAESFVAETYKVLVEHSGYQSLTDIVASSIGRFLEFLDGQPEVANNVIGVLLQAIFESLPHLKAESVSSIVGLIAKIVATSPVISEAHWQIIQLLIPVVPLARDEVCVSFKNLVIRDKETACRPDIAPKLIELALSMIRDSSTASNLTPWMSFLSSVLVVVSGTSAVDQSSVVPAVFSVAMSGFEVPVTLPYASMLFGALLIFNSEATLALLGAGRVEFLGNWLQSVKIVVLLAVLTRCYASFTNEELAVLITRGCELMQQETKNFEESLFRGDIEQQITEEMEKRYCVPIQSLDLFELAQLIPEFARLIESLNNGRLPGIVQHVEAQAGVPLASLFENVQKIY